MPVLDFADPFLEVLSSFSRGGSPPEPSPAALEGSAGLFPLLSPTGVTCLDASPAEGSVAERSVAEGSVAEGSVAEESAGSEGEAARTDSKPDDASAPCWVGSEA